MLVLALQLEIRGMTRTRKHQIQSYSWHERRLWLCDSFTLNNHLLDQERGIQQPHLDFDNTQNRGAQSTPRYGI
jgi:hypothetical protein